jgi:hypothetical protein
VRIIVHPHAYVHGLSDGQIRTAFDTGASQARIRRRDPDADPPRWGLIGFDPAARPIELVVVALLGGDALIIHANYLTRGFAQEMREAR